MADNNSQQMEMPAPNPMLKRLDRLVGTWTMDGHTLDSQENNVYGQTTFEWLPGGFFLQQRIKLNFAGLEIESLELIGYDSETNTISSRVYSNLAPVPLPYQWDLQDDTLTISVSYSPLDATFKGKFSQDGKSFSGGWRPNPGADERVNIPYDISGSRVE